MKPLYSNQDYLKSKSNDMLPIECSQCKNIFHKKKKYITSELKLKKGEIKFCSHNCKHLSFNKRIIVNCSYCNSDIERIPSEIKRNKNSFCSQSCSASYNNKHKTTGNRRSKLEIWLEQQLTILYTNLPIDFNKKDTIGSELDIYIPSLNLAIEINGIFHYEPIYGVDKLRKINENDISKSKACHDAKIDLCIINTSQQKYVKPTTSQKYLDIITNIINERL
jgi:hypothetical protein